jgi:hypothetical protein
VTALRSRRQNLYRSTLLVKRHSSAGGGSILAFAIDALIAYARRSNHLPVPVPQR